MRTRSNTRKPITIPGRYFTGLGTPEDVAIADLSPGGCRFASRARRIAPGSPIQIFIGAAGPYQAVVKWVEAGEIGAAFSHPLGDDEFRQFQSTHVPDRASEVITGEFVDTRSMPQRLC
ncbi:PilZ domain-containing protein [Qipengyuania nanhaisediminis]|uniref:PilZ domain-containing protein n=1 Tax=Qipengyuania nanhaisediminis TaxID=604088 RepID=UPI0038B3A536